MEIAKVDSLEHIKNNVRLYLAFDKVNGFELASKLAIDALSTGADDVTMRRNGDWWVVSSLTNWIENNPEEYPIELLFSQICANPCAGANAMRNEILLAAFADTVVLFSCSVAEGMVVRTIQGTQAFEPAIIAEDVAFGIAFSVRG